MVELRDLNRNREFTQLGPSHIESLARQIQGIDITHIPGRYSSHYPNDSSNIRTYSLRAKAAFLQSIFKQCWGFGNGIYIGVVVTDDFGSDPEISGAFLRREEADDSAIRLSEPSDWGGSSGAAVIETTCELLEENVGFWGEGWGTAPNPAVYQMMAEYAEAAAKNPDLAPPTEPCVPFQRPKTRQTSIATWHDRDFYNCASYVEKVWLCLVQTLEGMELPEIPAPVQHEELLPRSPGHQDHYTNNSGVEVLCSEDGWAPEHGSDTDDGKVVPF